MSMVEFRTSPILDEHPTEVDLSLVERAKSDRAAMSMLYRSHYPRIAGYVRRRVGPGHDADDIIANVFLAMVKKLHKFKPARQSFAAWLYQIAINEIRQWARWRKIRRVFGFEQEPAGPQIKPVDDAEVVRTALWRLPRPHQDVVTLYYLQELSVTEVAEVLGIAPGTVKSRLNRGREMLKSLVSSHSGPIPNRK